MLSNAFKAIALCALGCVASISNATMQTSTVRVNAPDTDTPMGYAFSGVRDVSIVMQNWAPNHTGFRATATEKVSVVGDKAKAATDPVAVFRPLAACRLVDTRGNGAPITGGPIATGVTRTINASGVCGIPANGLTGLSISFHAYNGNTALGSVIAMMPVGASTAGSMVGFHSGPMNWFMTSANIKTADSGNFDIFVGGGATLDIIVDVNGYYQNMDAVDVGDQQLDFNGSGIGDILGVNQSGTGNAIYAQSTTGSALRVNSAQAGNALRIVSGRFAIAGSSAVNSTTQAAFIHTTSVSTICATTYSIMKHASLDNNPNALIFITPRRNSVGGDVFPSATDVPSAQYYVGGCNSTSASTGHWYIRNGESTFPVSRSFNVMIITQ